jgi:hypothetical protein
MLYQLSYTRVPRILALQDFGACGVFSPTGNHWRSAMSALWGTSKKSGGSLDR